MSETTRTHTTGKQSLYPYQFTNEAPTDRQTNVSLRFRGITHKNLGHKIYLL